MPTIRTTMRPGDEIVVSDAEYEQLLALGLIYDGTPPVEPADPFDVRVAARLADEDSNTRAAIDLLVTEAAEAVQDPYVAGLINDSGSATDVALRAAFVSAVDTDGDPIPGMNARIVFDVNGDIDDITLVEVP